MYKNLTWFTRCDSPNTCYNYKIGTQVLCQEFEIASAACSIDESSEPQNLRVPIVLRTSKSMDARRDFLKFCRFQTPLASVLTKDYSIQDMQRSSSMVTAPHPYCHFSTISGHFFRQLPLYLSQN